MSLRRFVNKKALLLTVVVFAAAASTAVAMSLSGDGTIVGSSGPDQINAGNGMDKVYGQGGADIINVGNGGSASDPNIVDGDGNCGTQAPGVYPNGLNSTTGCEDGQGQNGDGNPGQQGPGPGDQINVGNGDNTVFGGAGMKNQINVGQGSDTIYGGPNNDVINTGSGGQATIWLGPGANTVNLGRVAKGASSVVHAYIAGDTAVDTITCNGGNSTVFKNSQDVITNSKMCGTVMVGSGGHMNWLGARDLARAHSSRAHKRSKRHAKRAHRARR